MKSSNKGWDQCGNAQAVANEDQIIVSADVTDQANDVRQVQPMLDQTIENLDAIGVTDPIGAFTADAGYFSETNVAALEQNDRVREAYLATGRLKHHEQLPAAPRGRPPKGLSVKAKMARKLRTKRGRAEYARRKAIIEPIFGQIKHCRGFRQFLLRGLQKMKAEWKLICLTHNILKLWRNQTNTKGIAAPFLAQKQGVGGQIPQFLFQFVEFCAIYATMARIVTSRGIVSPMLQLTLPRG